MLAAEPIIWSTVARSAQLRKPRTSAISSRTLRRSSSTGAFAGIAAVVVGEIHAAAQRGAGGVGHHGREHGRVGGEGDGLRRR